ncbi:MAG: radical SAM protein [Proteobacteria bacterium]|nr:radical SAM protein [Pseudomonadota bacterium]MBU4037303.1 radical SAM protein [Pseudomonadota bacterium]
MPNSKRDFIIPVFVPHAGCPHQCIFCNQNTVTGEVKSIPSRNELNNIIETFLKFKGNNRNRVQIAFYGGNFLGIDTDIVRQLLVAATKYVTDGLVDSIRFSTRPDTIDDHKLDIIENYPVKTIELGVQSMDDSVLLLSKRGHTYSDTINAVALLKKRNFETGLQMMIGLPGDDESKSLATARYISALCPDFVRIYPTLVLAGSTLAVLYKKGMYKPLSIEQGVAITKKIYLVFKENKIKVIRMGLQATDELKEGSSVIAGPYHPAFGHLVYSELFLDKVINMLEAKHSSNHDSIVIKVHPKSISMLRGLKNINIQKIKDLFGIKSIDIIPDISLSRDEVKAEYIDRV